MPRPINRQQALEALETLRKFGSQSFHEPNNVPKGRAIGKAISSCTIEEPNSGTLFDIAEEMFEDNNHHQAAAIVRCLQGQQPNPGVNMASFNRGKRKVVEFEFDFQDHYEMIAKS